MAERSGQKQYDQVPLSVPDKELYAWLTDKAHCVTEDGYSISRSQWICRKLKLVKEWEEAHGRPFTGKDCGGCGAVSFDVAAAVAALNDGSTPHAPPAPVPGSPTYRPGPRRPRGSSGRSGGGSSGESG